MACFGATEWSATSVNWALQPGILRAYDATNLSDRALEQQHQQDAGRAGSHLQVRRAGGRQREGVTSRRDRNVLQSVRPDAVGSGRNARVYHAGSRAPAAPWAPAVSDPKVIRILIVEDHIVARFGLKACWIGRTSD